MIAIALDDEHPALEVIKHFSNKCPQITLVNTFTSVHAAKKHLERHHVDIMFLDINMPAMSGLMFKKQLPDKIQVVFTTSYSDFALESYELNAADYLLKPFSFSRFLNAVNKACKLVKLSNLPDMQPFVFKSDYQNVLIDPMNIMFCEAMDNYLKIYTENKVWVIRMTLKEALAKLPEPYFQKIHRSYIVNMSYVQKFDSKNVFIKENIIPFSTIYVGNPYDFFI